MRRIVLRLIGLGRAHQPSPFGDSVLRRQDVDVRGTAAHEGQQAIVEELVPVLVVERLGLLARYRRATRSDNFETILDYDIADPLKNRSRFQSCHVLRIHRSSFSNDSRAAYAIASLGDAVLSYPRRKREVKSIKRHT